MKKRKIVLSAILILSVITVIVFISIRRYSPKISVSYSKTKSVKELTVPEYEMMINLLESIYVAEYNDMAKFLIIEFTSLPNRDGYWNEDQEKLNEPINFLSVYGLTIDDEQEAVRRLKNKAYEYGITSRISGKEMRIIKCVVEIDPKGSNKLNFPDDLITIVPLKFEIRD